MKLKRKPLVMTDIVSLLQAAAPGYALTRKDIYNTIMQGNKYRSYLTNNRYHSILALMSRRGIVVLDGDNVTLNPQLVPMSNSEVMAVVSMPNPWPKDVIDGLI